MAEGGLENTFFRKFMDKCSFDLKSPSDKSRRVFFGSDDDDRMYPTTMDHFRAQRTASVRKEEN